MSARQLKLRRQIETYQHQIREAERKKNLPALIEARRKLNELLDDEWKRNQSHHKSEGDMDTGEEE